MKKIIVLTLIVLCLALPAAAFEIRISAVERVSKDQITLAEIAAVSSFSGEKAELEELQRLELSTAPRAGYAKNINRVLIELSIKSLGYSEADFELLMPKRVRVERQSQIIKAAEIESFIKSYLESEVKREDSQVIIETISELKDEQIAAGDYRFRIADNFSASFGRNNLPLEIVIGERVEKRLFYNFKLGLKTTVLTAARNLAYGTIITEADFISEEKKLFANADEQLREWNDAQLAGQELRRTLRKGDLLSLRDLKDPYVVEWGDKLRLNMELNSVSLSATVEARGRGTVGDLITVENIDSGYRFQARIISASEVEKAH